MEHYDNYTKEKDFNAILPNLKYKNNKIFYIFKDPFKIIQNKKIKFIKEYDLGDISLTGKIYCMGTEIKCKILEKEIDNGLEVNICYIDTPNINRDHKKKFARALEARILNIEIDDDDDSENSVDFNFDNEYKNKMNYLMNQEEEEELDIKFENLKINNNSEFNDLEDYTKYEIDKFKDNL